MTVIESTVLIQRPPEEVFDYLSDPRNELEWNPKVKVMEKLTDGPVGVGTTFRAKWTKSGVVTLECREYDRPRHWRFVNGGPLSVDFSVDLTPESGGTRFTSRFDATPHGFLGSSSRCSWSSCAGRRPRTWSSSSGPWRRADRPQQPFGLPPRLGVLAPRRRSAR